MRHWVLGSECEDVVRVVGVRCSGDSVCAIDRVWYVHSIELTDCIHPPRIGFSRFAPSFTFGGGGGGGGMEEMEMRCTTSSQPTMMHTYWIGRSALH
jgi:hypothetical protein